MAAAADPFEQRLQVTQHPCDHGRVEQVGAVHQRSRQPLPALDQRQDQVEICHLPLIR